MAPQGASATPPTPHPPHLSTCYLSSGGARCRVHLLRRELHSEFAGALADSSGVTAQYLAVVL